MPNPADRKYSKEHEWVLMESDGSARIGITDFAQTELGDVVYVQLPKVGDSVTQFSQIGEVESVKAVSELFCPIGGEVTEVNDAVVKKPELVNTEPYAEGWLIKVKVSNASELDTLLDAEAYGKLTGEG
ncbi:MAG: glycine cleavage system protein GcvH [Chloroflexi bacterium]|nr:glycine cleavage system protein GcvH [Chloroflexota bacterium]